MLAQAVEVKGLHQKGVRTGAQRVCDHRLIGNGRKDHEYGTGRRREIALLTVAQKADAVQARQHQIDQRGVKAAALQLLQYPRSNDNH